MYLGYLHTVPMKKRLDQVLLGFGVGLYACAVLGMVLVRLTGNSALLWLLVPSFLLIGIGGDRKLWQKTDTALVQDSIDSIWFAPNS